MNDVLLHKLQRRIAVHDRYALAAALYVYTHKLFNKTDAICQKIASYYTMHPNAKINPMQMGMLKKRMPAYAPVIHKIQTDIPLRFLEAAKQCTYESMSNHVDNTNIGTAGILGASNKFPYILLSFKFDPIIIEKLKKLESPKFDTATKKWKVKATISNAEYLLAMGFVFDQELLDWYHTYCYKFYPEPQSDVRIRGIKKQFLTFQKHGIAYVVSRRNRALIGDEMGVGKTIQAIGWLQYLAYERPCIIICPASLKYNWAKEIEAWVKNPTIYIISGSPDINDNHEQVYNDKYLYSSSGSKNIFIIINYDIISNDFEKCVNDEGKTVQYEIRNSKWVDYLRRLKIRCAVIDEAQYLKNKEAHRSMAILSLCKDIPNILALSGTPIDNRPIEFFNILNMLNPYQFPSKAEYAKRYCGAVHNGFGWDFSGSSNLKELHEIVSKSVMIRRLKEHVLSELPPKRRVIVDIELTNKADYIKAKTNVIDWLRNEGLTAQAISAERAEALAKINILLQLALKGKLKSCIEWIHTYLESGEKLVVFTTHRKTVEILMKEFGHFTQNKKGIAVEVDGSTPVKTRQKHVELFQENPKCKLFVGNIQAAGVGLTLTKAPDTCFVELGMVPGHHLQAEDRVHRIGQKASAVCAYYLIAKGTIEEDIARLLSSKYEVLKLALDGIEINESEQSKQQHSLLVDLVDTLQTLA